MLTKAPGMFQSSIDILLEMCNLTYYLMYLEDITVFSNNVDDPITHVRNVMCVLQCAGFTLNLKKCECYTDVLNYLEHVRTCKPPYTALDRGGKS